MERNFYWGSTPMKLLLLLLSSLLAGTANAQRRALMEGLQASNNALYVSTPTANLYVQTAGTMTVKGNAFSVGTSTLIVAGGVVMVGTNTASGMMDVNGTVRWGGVPIGHGLPATLPQIIAADTGGRGWALVNRDFNGLTVGSAIRFDMNAGSGNTGSTMYVQNQGGVAGGTMTINAVNIGPSAPANSQALCLLGATLGHCTSAVGAGGGCTCVSP